MRYDTLNEQELIRIASMDATTPLELALLAAFTGEDRQYSDELEDRLEEADSEIESLEHKVSCMNEDLLFIRNTVLGDKSDAAKLKEITEELGW